MQKISPLVFFLFLGCAASNSDNSASTTSSSTSQTCRTYATNITDTTNSITYTCTFNGTTTLSCTNGGTETITFTYPSKQVFIDEAPAGLTVFNKTRASSAVFGSATTTRQHSFAYTYNGSGQLTSAVDTGNGFVASYTYTSWDAHNRPTAMIMSFTSGAVCSGRTFSIAYVDGTTRTKAFTLTAAGTGGNCGVINPATDQQDANGNPTSSSLGMNFTVNSTTSACY